MLKNWNHDLIQQLSEISDSLWRIEQYQKNAQECGHCFEMWKKIHDYCETISKMLVEEIGRHYHENRFE